MEERLQKFARLTEIGSFTKAAKVLHISQPALSIAIDKLEQELGTELLIRGNRKLVLTDGGRAAYIAALEHQNSTDHLRAELSRIAKQRPIINIGMTDSVAAILCATEAFDELERTASVTVIVNNSRYLREAVEQRQLDVAFIVDDGAEHVNLKVAAIGIEELVLVCHPNIVTQVEQELAEGKLRNFICYDKPSTTYRHIQQALRANNIKPHVSLYSTSPDVMLVTALRGKGVGVLPKFLVHDKIAHGSLSQINYLQITRPICSVSLRGKPVQTQLRNFQKYATQILG